MTLPPAILRKASAILRDAADGKPVDAREAERISKIIAPRRKAKKHLPWPTLKEAREAKRKARSDATSYLRNAVEERAFGHCEAADHIELLSGGAVCRGYLELDHLLGGVGRRRQKQAVENTWLLCNEHHRQRTANLPSSDFWVRVFALHADRYGYPMISRVEHRRIER